MPTFPITDPQLLQLTNFLSTASYIYYPISTSFFYDLYKTGCRPEELLQIDRWIYNSPTDIQLTPLKGNSTRYFLESQLSTELVYCIINQINPYQNLTLRQLSSVLKKILPVIQITTTEKSAIDYMFRYNFIKQLHIKGKTDAEIQDIMGWSTPLLSSGYYSMQMYSDPILPPFNPVISMLSYLATVSQSGTFDPTVNELFTDIGSPTRTYVGPGDYTLTWSAGTFDSTNATVFHNNFNATYDNVIQSYITGDSEITITSVNGAGSPINGALVNCSFMVILQ